MRVSRKNLIWMKKKQKRKLPSRMKLFLTSLHLFSKNHMFGFVVIIAVLTVVIFVMAALIEGSRTRLVIKSPGYVNAHKPSLVVRANESNQAVESQEKYLIIYDSDNEVSKRLHNNIKQTLQYIKKPLETVSASEFTAINRPYTSVIVALGDWDKISSFSALLNYMEDGGSVFFAHKPETTDALHLIYRKIGIHEIGQDYANKGIKLTSNVMLHSKGLQVEDGLITNFSLMLRMDENSNMIHARTPEGIPVLWETEYGEGKIMIFNGTMLQWPSNRGFFVGALSLLAEDFIYPVMNMKLTFLDKFPGPLPTGFNQKIYDEYRLSLDKFYRNIWWQDLLKGMKEYDLKYTGAFLVSLGENNEDEIFEPEQQWAPLVQYGRELLNNGGELGINGYYNKPLIVEKNEWTSKEMTSSLEVANAVLKRVFPSYEFHTYIPPGNRLDQIGLKSVHRALPHVKTISSMYQQSSEDGQLYEQEFNISKDGMAAIPRMTFGYEWTPSMQWQIANGITSIGVYSHVIEPPYTFTEEVPWKRLSKSYNEMLQMLRNKFGWLRSMTATEAANELAVFEHANVSIHRKFNQLDVYVDDLPKDFYFIYRTKQTLSACQGCSYELIDDETYLIQAKENILQLIWEAGSR